jgi:hypothetical protein
MICPSCPRLARHSAPRNGPNASRACCKSARRVVEQVRHRAVRTMSGDQFVARKRSPPIAPAARDKYGLALFIGEPVERLLDV